MTRATSGTGLLTGTTQPLATAFDAALFDLDGVVYRGPFAVEHARESIAAARSAGQRTLFITNNANREPDTVAAHLTRIGVPSDPVDVVTSAQVAAQLLGEELPAGARVLAVGGPGLLTALRERGLTVVTSADDTPLAVVQGFAPEVGWRQLAEAVYAVSAGARFVATNLDLTIPTERGIAPGNGTLVEVVRVASGVDPVSAGKPQPTMFHVAAERVGAQRPLVVGDRLDTDLAGAVAAGQAGLHVLTGVNGPADLVAARVEERPRFLGRDLRDLLVAHPAPEDLDDGRWACRGAEAALARDGEVAVVTEADGRSTTLMPGTDAAISLDALRALCCAAWVAADSGRPLPRLTGLGVVVEDGGAAR
jgi:glycerol-1-phosphatase